MPRSSFAGSLTGPKVDVMIDLGNPFFNHTVDGFLKIGTVRSFFFSNLFLFTVNIFFFFKFWVLFDLWNGSFGIKRGRFGWFGFRSLLPELLQRMLSRRPRKVPLSIIIAVQLFGSRETLRKCEWESINFHMLIIL